MQSKVPFNVEPMISWVSWDIDLTCKHIPSNPQLRWFLGIALHIPTAPDFRVIGMRIQSVRDFPQTKLDSEINAPFLLNEHGDPFLFHNFNEDNILNNWEKY